MCMGKLGKFKIRRRLPVTQNDVETCGTFNIVAIAYNTNSLALICDMHICFFVELLHNRKFPQGGGVGSLHKHTAW